MPQNNLLIKKIQEFLFPVVLVIVASFLTLYNLGKSTLVNWDEGIYANILYDMGRIPRLTMFYMGELWMEKPPFGFWLHMIGTKMFGMNTFGIRFMPAMFFICSILFLYLLLKNFYSTVVSFFITLAFAVSPVLYAPHMIRTGDFEMYFLGTTIAAFWLYVMSWEKPKYFLWVGVLIGIGFLTRGYIAILVFLAVLIHLAWDKKYIVIGKQRIFNMIVSFVAVVFPWHIYAFVTHPSEFFHSYLEYHFLDRVIQALPGHAGSIYFYFDFLYGCFDFAIIFFVICFAVLVWRLFKYKKSEDRLWFCWLLIFIIPLHLMQTKILWYALGFIPALYAQTVPTLIMFFEWSKKNFFTRSLRNYFAIIVFIYLLFCVAQAVFVIANPVVLPVEQLVSFVHSKNITHGSVIVFSKNDTFCGPAAIFELNKINHFTVDCFPSDISASIKSKENNIFLTDGRGYFEIEKTDTKKLLKGYVLDWYHDDWGEKDVPVVVIKKTLGDL